MTITLRATKGSPLTHGEMDDNLVTLRDVASQTSGSINNVIIGASTAAAGNFTSLSATGNVTLGDGPTDTVTVNGNMGVGVTPSPSGTYRCIQLGVGGVFGTKGITANFAENAYLAGSGTWTYATTGAVGLYQSSAGVHQWYSKASGTADTAISFGTASMTLDITGNLGIGVTPSAWSQSRAIEVGSAGNALWGNGANDFRMFSNAYYASGPAYKYANTAAASYYGQINGAHWWYSAPSGTAGNTISWTQVLAVEKDKSVALQGATSQTGAGITFPATQSASSDANTLDDYEEGTWTPVLSDGTNNATMAGGSAGVYTKVGRLIHINGYLATTSLGSVTGNIIISGLPFTPANLTNNIAGAVAGFGQNLAITAGTSVGVYIGQNQAYMQLQTWDAATGTTDMQATEWSADGALAFNFTYTAAT